MGKMKLLAAGAAAAAALSTGAARADDFSFSGSLTDPNQVLFFDFAVGTASNVTLRSYSYAGGTNAHGTAIASGGFDPILGVYDFAGNRIGQNDDGSCANVAADPSTGYCYDTFFRSLLAPGSYRAAVSAYSNFGPLNLNTGTFENDGSFSGRTSNFAFDVLGVDSAVGPGGSGVPEPATWALMIIGFGAVGSAMRRRPKVSANVHFA